MARTPGTPNMRDLVGLPYYALNHRWFVMVQPRSIANHARWVSVEDFEQESGAETYWAQYKADTAGMARGVGGVFKARFKRIADHVPPVAVQLASSSGVVFHVEQRLGRWHIWVDTPTGKWVSIQSWKTEDYATNNRKGWRRVSNTMSGAEWLNWLNLKFKQLEG